MPHAVPRRAAAAIAASPMLSIGGVILFVQDSLTDPARGPGYLSRVVRAAFQF